MIIGIKGTFWSYLYITPDLYRTLVCRKLAMRLNMGIIAYDKTTAAANFNNTIVINTNVLTNSYTPPLLFLYMITRSPIKILLPSFRLSQ